MFRNMTDVAVERFPAGAENNGRAIFRQREFRKIYAAKTLEVYSLKDIDEARLKLLGFKSSVMQGSEGMYQEVQDYLRKQMMLSQPGVDTMRLYELLLQSYRNILMNDNSEVLEKLHCDLVRAVHRYYSEAESIVKQNKAAWKKVIERMAERLEDEVYAYEVEW